MHTYFNVILKSIVRPRFVSLKNTKSSPFVDVQRPRKHEHQNYQIEFAPNIFGFLENLNFKFPADFSIICRTTKFWLWQKVKNLLYKGAGLLAMINIFFTLSSVCKTRILTLFLQIIQFSKVFQMKRKVIYTKSQLKMPGHRF